jgi:hypothetical protein
MPSTNIISIALAHGSNGVPKQPPHHFRLAIDWQEGASEKNAQPVLNLGSLLTDQGKVEAGLPYLLKAAEMAPRNPKCHEALGRAYAKLDRCATLNATHSSVETSNQ